MFFEPISPVSFSRSAPSATQPKFGLLLTASTLFAKNLWRPIFAPGMTDEGVALLARTTVMVLSALSVYFAIYSSSTLVALLLLGYAGVAQFFPGVVLGLFWNRTSATGVFIGMALGVAVVAFLILTKRDPIYGLNAGFVGLCLNFLITVTVSLLVPSSYMDCETV